MSSRESAMDVLYVQFSDEKETVIISWFCCQQPPGSYPNLGEVFPNDPRYIAYYDSQPDWVKEALPQPITG